MAITTRSPKGHISRLHPHLRMPLRRRRHSMVATKATQILTFIAITVLVAEVAAVVVISLMIIGVKDMALQAAQMGNMAPVDQVASTLNHLILEMIGMTTKTIMTMVLMSALIFSR